MQNSANTDNEKSAYLSNMIIFKVNTNCIQFY